MQKLNRRNFKNKKQKRQPNLLYKQLTERDMYVIDYLVTVNETADIGYDLYTQISGSTDYTNLQLSYGEFSFRSVTFQFVPFFCGSALATDYANGVFGTRQGVFDTGVTNKTVAALIRTPGSRLIDNKTKWSMTVPILHSTFFASSETNTATSDVPKLNYYFAWLNNASTNTSKGMLAIRLKIQARSKID